MPDHLFLCGLSPTQRTAYEGGRELHLHGSRKNLRLEVDDIRGRLSEVEPKLLTDLVEIASYVFAADNLVSRGGDVLRNMGKAWRRRFRLVIAVRQPGIWKEPQHLHALCTALQFLSEDNWDFEFISLEKPPSIQTYLTFTDVDVEKAAGTTIVLFSGGLDSFAGAVHELLEGNQHVVLLSRRLGGMTDSRQRELASELKQRHPRWITFTPVKAGLTDEARAVEHTQRTRSFLLTAMALVAAEMEQAKLIRFYENGIMSVNLPISTQVVGARSSRSTHPRALALLQNLCRLLSQRDIVIENPFILKTKVEVVMGLLDKPEEDAIRHTLSCSCTRDMTIYKPHCGACAQCLHRRIATLGAGASEADPTASYATDLLLGPREPGVDRTMAVDIVRSALEFRRLSEESFATRFAGEFAWLTMSFPAIAPDEVARKFVALFRRHGEAVRSIFTKAAANHASDLIDHTLPDSCLLQMVIRSPDINIDQGPIVSPSPGPAREFAVSQETTGQGIILVAIDDVGKRILIDGIVPLTASMEFRLVSTLVRLHREDRESERAPENYRSISAEDLAKAVSTTGEIAGRRAIFRLRKKINSEYQELYGSCPDSNAIVENIPGKGYRINPAVRVVAPDQIRP